MVEERGLRGEVEVRGNGHRMKEKVMESNEEQRVIIKYKNKLDNFI